MRPVVEISIGGTPVSSTFYSQLISVTVSDQEGHKADTVRMELNDFPFARIPERGDSVSVKMGYSFPQFMGDFTVDEVEVQCFPAKMTISGKSADLRKEMKSQKERHWDDVTVADVVSEIAGEHGLSPQISGSVGAHKFDWLGQQDESDMHFLERLARRHNALFSVKNGKLIFAERGSGQKPSGTDMSTVSITPDKILVDSCRIRFKDRSQYKDVVAYFQDNDKAERVEVKVQSDPKGTATHSISEPYGSVEEAEKAAGSKAKELTRGVDKASVTVVGDPSIRAGAPMVFANVRPGVDGIQFIIESAKHTFSKTQGMKTQIEANRKE